MNARLNNDIKAGIFGRTGNWPFDAYDRGIRSLTSSTRRDSRGRRARCRVRDTILNSIATLCPPHSRPPPLATRTWRNLAVCVERLAILSTQAGEMLLSVDMQIICKRQNL